MGPLLMFFVGAAASLKTSEKKDNKPLVLGFRSLTAQHAYKPVVESSFSIFFLCSDHEREIFFRKSSNSLFLVNMGGRRSVLVTDSCMS